MRFFKLYFDFNVFSAENRRLFSIEFQLHTNSHITLWLPVVKTAKYENLSLPAHFNGIPTTCTLEMEFFSQLRNYPEVTGLPVCHVM